MAQGKKSFIAYSDWKNIFDELPNEEAGLLIKHIFAYVNDENPVSNNLLIRAVFANIKTTLKRDLERWNNQIKQRSEAGKISAQKRMSTKVNERSTVVEADERNSTVNVNDNVNVNDTDTVNEERIHTFNFKKSLIALGVDEKIVSEWMEVRKKKKAANTETAFNAIKKQIELSGAPANECIKRAVEKSWCGFESEWYKNATKKVIPEYKPSYYESARNKI